MANINKIPRTIYFTTAILNALEEVKKNSVTGEKKNSIILNCIVYGLKELYKTDLNGKNNK